VAGESPPGGDNQLFSKKTVDERLASRANRITTAFHARDIFRMTRLKDKLTSFLKIYFRSPLPKLF
jgi:hypothetical protein